MRKYLYIGILIATLLGVIGAQYLNLRRAKADRDAYRFTSEALLGGNEYYRTRDSLNAVSVRTLELKLGEYERFRSDDAALIRSLRVDRKRLERITTTQLQTTYDLYGHVVDTVVYQAISIPDTLRCIDITEPWFDLHGCSNSLGDFSGTFESRDSLLYVEHVEYKRFLGFLWRTKKVKSRRQEIVSRNPHTRILDAEFVTFRE